MPRYTPEYCESLLAENPQACTSFYDRIMRGKVIADVADHTTFVLKALEDGPKSAIPVAVWCRSNGDPGMEGELARRICDRLVRESKAFKDGQVYSAAPSEAASQIASTVAALGCVEKIMADPKYDVEIAVGESLAEPPTPKREWSSPKTKVLPKLPATREAINWPDIIKLCLSDVQVIQIDVPAGKSPAVFARDIRGRLHSGKTKLWNWSVSHLTDGNFVEVRKVGLNPKYPSTEDFQQPSAVLSQQPTPLGGAFPINGSETSKTVTLQSGGTLTLHGTLDLFSLTSSDRQFVFDLIDKLDGYEMAQRFQEQI